MLLESFVRIARNRLSMISTSIGVNLSKKMMSSAAEGAVNSSKMK